MNIVYVACPAWVGMGSGAFARVSLSAFGTARL